MTLAPPGPEKGWVQMCLKTTFTCSCFNLFNYKSVEGSVFMLKWLYCELNFKSREPAGSIAPFWPHGVVSG